MAQKFLRTNLLFICSLLLGCASQSQLMEGLMETEVQQELHYYLYYPQDYKSKADKDFGLLLFLHGGGGSGEALSTIKKSGPPKLLVEGKQFPFLVLVPQNPNAKKWWNTASVMQLLDSIVETNRVDKNRIYLTGLSRGGGAAWEMVTQYPNKFAAMAVVCGMAPLPYAHWIDKNMPIWVFHGARDKIINIQESDDMVKRLKSMGYTVQYTRYEDMGHNVWDRTYTNDELYEWFSKQSRKK